MDTEERKEWGKESRSLKMTLATEKHLLELILSPSRKDSDRSLKGFLIDPLQEAL